MKNWNLHLVKCFEKGAKAFFDGDKECPYLGRIGFNHQRRDYWNMGYEAAHSGKIKEYETKNTGTDRLRSR